MQRVFSFHRHPFENVLHHLSGIMDGIDWGMAVYYSFHDDGIVALRAEQGMEPVEMDYSSIREKLLQLRHINRQKEWVTLHELPFQNEPKQARIQTTIEDEIHRNILVIRIQNPYDRLFDALILSFTGNLIFLNDEKQERRFKIPPREAIEKSLFGMIHLMYQQHLSDKKLFEFMLENWREVEKENKFLKNQLADNQRLVNDILKMVSSSIAAKITGDKPVRILFTDNAIKKIAAAYPTMSQLETIIENAVILAINRYYHAQLITLDEQDVIIPEKKKPDSAETPDSRTLPQHQDIFANTIQMLDRYEHAVKKVITSGEKVTGKNVGACCEPPVSAPAISDFIRKHRRKILLLFARHPDRWQHLRNDFKPFVKLTDRQQRYSQSAS